MGSVEIYQCNTQISLVHLSPRSINLSQISCFCFLVSPHQVLCYTLCTYCLSSSQQSCKTGFTIFVSRVRKQCPRALLISLKSTNQGLTSLLQGTILRITNLWLHSWGFCTFFFCSSHDSDLILLDHHCLACIPADTEGVMREGQTWEVLSWSWHERWELWTQGNRRAKDHSTFSTWEQKGGGVTHNKGSWEVFFL